MLLYYHSNMEVVVKDLVTLVGALRTELDSLREEVRQLKKQREVTKEETSSKGTSSWRVAKDRGLKKTLIKPPSNAIATSNSFDVLEDECCGETVDRAKGKATKRKEAQAPQKVKEVPKQTLVVGDSQIRYLDRTFCARDRGNRLRVCYPGAGIGDIINNMNDIMAGNGNNPIICISVGGNDVGRVRSEELIQRYKTAIELVRSKGGIPIICGILPRKGVGNEWISRALGVNCRLERYCKSNAISFIDNWEHFYGRNEMYARDGVHLSRAGVVAVANSLEEVVRGVCLGLNC